MAQPSLIDVLTPFDPSGYAAITGPELQQFGSGISPYSDKGFTVVTTDIAGVPQVPDAATNTKWKTYLWIRQDSVNISAYLWNEEAVSDGTYLKWISVNAAVIGAGVIEGYMIANNTITDINILNVDWSKLYGTPPPFYPEGPAGGDLDGTYPDPTIADDAVTTSKILDDAVTADKMANNSVAVASNLIAGLTPYQQVRTNAGITACEWFTPQVIVNLINPVGVGDAAKVVRVNAGGTGYELGGAQGLVTTKFVATAIAVSAGGLLYNQPHGLGAVPDVVTCRLVCVDAGGDAGYFENDEINISAVAVDYSGDADVNYRPAFVVGCEADNVSLSQATIATGTFSVIDKTTSSGAGITLSKWRAKIVAIRYA